MKLETVRHYLHPVIYCLPFLFTVFFGVFDAAQTARKDYPAQSIFWNHGPDAWSEFSARRSDKSFRDSVKLGLTKFSTFDLWYIGGNEFYSPPKYFWTSDFWHTMKNLWVLCITGIGVSCIMVGYQLNEKMRRLQQYPMERWRKALQLSPFALYVLLYWIEGATFSFFYHHVFR